MKKEYTHPGDPEHVMRIYRRHILAMKKKYGNARCLIHYQRIVDEYLAAKRVFLKKVG